MLELKKGRPTDTEGRLEKEIRVYDRLDALEMTYERVDHPAAMTMEDCLAVDAVLDAAICKNLLLRNTQKTAFYLLMMPGEKKFKTKELSRQIGSARLSFAEPEYMEAFLDITPGSLSVLGLMNDTENRVRLLIDADLLRSETIGVHPCINTASLRLRTQELLEIFLKDVKHEPVFVQLQGEEAPAAAQS